MKSAKMITLLAVSVLLVAMNAVADHDNNNNNNNIRWRDIIGNAKEASLVGVGDQGFTGAPFGVQGILGGAPWSTLGRWGEGESGHGSGAVQRQGARAGGRQLQLSVGLAIPGLQIGTTGGITSVKGTIVCNVNGTGDGSGKSTVVDTPPTTLNATGDAFFVGNVGPLPDVCTSDDRSQQRCVSHTHQRRRLQQRVDRERRGAGSPSVGTLSQFPPGVADSAAPGVSSRREAVDTELAGTGAGRAAAAQ